MKILITGGSGMLGSSLKKFAILSDAEVLTPNRMEMNLLDKPSIDAYLASTLPDAVFHAAARVGGISANIADPLGFLTENLEMDLNFLTMAKEFEIPKLIYMGSSCMYPRNLDHAMREDEILTGPLEETNEGYALAKLVGWKLIRDIEAGSKLNWRTVILSNLYGPNDHFNPERSHLLAAIISKMIVAKTEGKEFVEMWGDGSGRREFTFVDDVGEFLINSLPTLSKFPTTMNIGVGKDYSVRQYYDFVADTLGYSGTIISDVSKPTGMKRKLMDSSLARDLGWNPKTKIEDGIRQTIDWYQSQANETPFE